MTIIGHIQLLNNVDREYLDSVQYTVQAAKCTYTTS
jgi:hypothetical protein